MWLEWGDIWVMTPKHEMMLTFSKLAEPIWRFLRSIWRLMCLMKLHMHGMLQAWGFHHFFGTNMLDLVHFNGILAIFYQIRCSFGHWKCGMYFYDIIAIRTNIACIGCELYQSAVHAWFEYDYIVKIGLRNIRNWQINAGKRDLANGIKQKSETFQILVHVPMYCNMVLVKMKYVWTC